MTLDDVVSRLTKVRKSGRGWMAQCPAHEDRNPSLSIHEGDDGTVLLHCFAGCTFQEIVRSMNLPFRKTSRTPRPPPKRKRKIDWGRVANTIQLRALEFWLRAEKTFQSVQGTDITTCSPEELESLLERVQRAYGDLHHADYLEDVAFDLRVRHINEKNHITHTKEVSHNESKPILTQRVFPQGQRIRTTPKR